MRGPLLRRRTDPALDTACQVVETTVSRVAKLVLHASALADRMELAAAVTGPLSPEQARHLRVLRTTADTGRQVLLPIGLAAASEAPGVP